MLFRAFFLSLILFFSITQHFCFAQLEETNTLALTEKKIKETEKIISTGNENPISMSRLKAVNVQIAQHNAVINALQNEIKLMQTNISETNEVIVGLENDVIRMKEEYSKLVFAALKTTNQLQTLSFIFSSQSVTQALLRLRYITQYQAGRRKQVAHIMKLSQVLDTRKEEMNEKIKQKQFLLEEEKKKKEKLLSLQENQTTLLKNLSKREIDLRQLEDERKEQAETANKEIVKKQTASEIPVRQKINSTKPNAEPAAVTSFEKAKGNLKMPVKEGFITMKYGKQPHPVLKGLIIENMGIDIRTSPDEPVTCVFEGKVSAVSEVPTMGIMVMVQHNDYYTVYLKLKEATVKIGDNLKAGTVIGTVALNEEGAAELQFQIWKNQKKLDPEAWLIK
jgi:septal ring factor EnvC (AmiA/AmiB activator)